MAYITDVIFIIALFSIYFVIHSYLASFEVKKNIKKTFGNFIAFYRLAYNIFAVFSLYLIYLLLPKPHLIIYDLPNPYDIIILVPQFAALVGIYWSFKYICVKEFLGLSQVKRYFNKTYDSKYDEEITLTFSGPYKYTRHPVYLFSMLFLVFRPTMDLFYLTFFLMTVIYFYIGSVYEERKMKVQFGEEYLKYQKAVPRFLPSIPPKPYSAEELEKT